jgi:SAM-dependent methyltransferase
MDTMIFSKYATHYDLFYADKDYAAEVDFVLQLAVKFGVQPKTVLDMGCGTGRHLVELAKRGLKGDGFDRSEEMLRSAKRRLLGLDLQVTEGDIRTFRNGRQYDLVLAMFAVMGYLITNNDLLAGLETAYKHLHPTGLLIFDGWFGPAVLSQRPEARTHKYENGNQTVLRKVTPHLDPIGQVVQVHYEVNSREAERLERLSVEDHRMRFMFVQEMKLAMNTCGLDLIYVCPFMDLDGKLTTETWNATFVGCRAQA